MALLTEPKQVAFSYMIGEYSARLIHGEEKASQTYIKGTFLQDDDSGRMVTSVSPIDGSGVTKRAIGLGLFKATGTTDADVTMVMVDANTVFEATLSDATATTHTLAQADKWQTFPVTKTATGNWYLDAAAVAANGGLVIGFKDAIGVVDARVFFILTAACRGPFHASSGAI